MKRIELQSPEAQNFEKDIMKISHEAFQEEKLGIKTPVKFTFFFSLPEEKEDFDQIVRETAMNTNHVNFVLQVKEMIGNCSQIGENLFQKLKSLMDKIKASKTVDDLFKKHEEKYEREYTKFDFMGYRNLLSDILKSKKIIDLTSKGFILKSVTKSFNDFILDRNKYTHGELMFWVEKNASLLEYENTSRETEYGLVTKEIMESYINCYKELNGVLDLIWKEIK